MIASILSLLLFLLAIVLILDLTPRRVTDDLLQLITPHQTLYERVKAIRGGKRKKGIYYKLMAMKQALEATGKHKQFTFICFASLVLFAAGIFLSILIHNLRHKESPRDLLTEENVELLTAPADLASYKSAIMDALLKGTKRNIESEADAKNVAVE